MPNRRDIIKLGLLTGGAAVVSPSGALAQLCGPDGTPPYPPSPPTQPFLTPLFIMPIAQPVNPRSLNPAPDPSRHQRWDDFPPQKYYVAHETAFMWSYHPEMPPTPHWGFDGITPGPTFHARYGEPVFLRRYNDLPPSQVGFGLNSTTIHLHNAHTASESDGNPLDWKDSGHFWDHHYANVRAGYDRYGGNGDPLETMTTLWYHDHRMEFTAANVYAGLTGFYLLFDERDTGNENDTSPDAYRLPSGKYDVPLILHDVQFLQNGQVFFDPFNTDGFLGDKFTVNRKIQPFFQVEARKYRFRILNGGPSRFYSLFLSNNDKFIQLSNDGNLLPEPIAVDRLDLSVAQRMDVVIDFSKYAPGTQLYLVNRLEQVNGKGPTGKLIDPGDQIMRFDVVRRTGLDRSRIPDKFRELPAVDLSEVVQERFWRFDYDGGLWTVNGKPFEMDRIDAEIRRGTAEVWTIRNEGTSWSHPVHIHFEEFQILEFNGKTIAPGTSDYSRKDVLTLGPNDEVKLFFRFRDFLGRYVMHCHNVVHEDHAMMIQWVIVP